MKEEIEKILDEAICVDVDEATIELQKLFLSKQIELLDKLYLTSTYALNGFIQIQRNKLQSELKQLQ